MSENSKLPEKKLEVMGVVNLKAGGNVYPNKGVVKITPIWDGEPGIPYFALQEIEELDLPAEKIQLKLLKGMSDDFETVVKPLLEGEAVKMEMTSKKDGRPYEAIFTFDPLGTPYHKGSRKPWHKGNLDMSFPPRSVALPPMQSVGFADVSFDNSTYADVEIFEAAPEGKSAYITFEIEALDIPLTKIRLYLPKDVNATFEEVIRPLVEGRSVEITRVSKKSGNEYTANYRFNPTTIPDFMSDKKNPSYTGALEMSADWMN